MANTKMPEKGYKHVLLINMTDTTAKRTALHLKTEPLKIGNVLTYNSNW